MAVTRIFTVVVEDDYELDSEALFDVVENALPCACGFVEPPKASCSMLVLSMNTFKHDDDEYVDWDPVIRNINDDDDEYVDNLVIGKGTQ